MPRKFLIIRFSAIGDVVLTTPVIRSLYQGIPDAEIHFLTKSSNREVLKPNPYIAKLHLFDGDLKKNIKELRKHEFEHVLDLHHNLRSLRVKAALRVPSSSFPKQNIQKWLMCHRRLRKLAKPIEHIVVRYARTLQRIGVPLDDDGLDMFLTKEMEEWARKYCIERIGSLPQLAIVLGGTHATKRWITDYFAPAINSSRSPVILIGGPDMETEAQAISQDLTVPYINTVGKHGILASAALMKQCKQVLCHDTGFMHIAAAFGQEIISIWGNTVPEFGMYPYKANHSIIEIENLSCRPCSKIGYNDCPKGHFRCMKEVRPERVASHLRR